MRKLDKGYYANSWLVTDEPLKFPNDGHSRMSKRLLNKKVYGKASKLTIRSPYAMHNSNKFVLVTYENRSRRNMDLHISGQIERYYDGFTDRMHSMNFSKHLTEYTMALVKHIVNNPDDRLRYEGLSLNLYSNNMETLEKLAYRLYELVQKDCDDYHNDSSTRKKIVRNQPGTEVVFYSSPGLLEDGTVVLKSGMKEWSHKIYLNYLITYSFGEWLMDNKDQLRMPSGLKHKLERQLGMERKTLRVNNNFFYVRNEQMLLLIKMSYAANIGKIYKVAIADDKTVSGPKTITPSQVLKAH